VKIKDLTNKKFGLLTAIKHDGKIGSHTAWLCKCECGNTKRVTLNNLQNKHVQSCGRNCTLKFIKTKHPLYLTWENMLARCYRKTNANYNLYGARGIKVCKRWLEFKNFITDMGVKPHNHTLDRIDNNGDYSPTNCRWASFKQQSNNKRDTIKVEGRTLRDIAEQNGIKYKTVSSRYHRGKRTIKELSKPV